MPEDVSYNRTSSGVWRSLVARTPGGREVIGSSPVTPTKAISSCRGVAQSGKRAPFGTVRSLVQIQSPRPE